MVKKKDISNSITKSEIASGARSDFNNVSLSFNNSGHWLMASDPVKAVLHQLGGGGGGREGG